MGCSKWGNHKEIKEIAPASLSYGLDWKQIEILMKEN